MPPRGMPRRAWRRSGLRGSSRSSRRGQAGRDLAIGVPGRDERHDCGLARREGQAARLTDDTSRSSSDLRLHVMKPREALRMRIGETLLAQVHMYAYCGHSRRRNRLVRRRSALQVRAGSRRFGTGVSLFRSLNNCVASAGSTPPRRRRRRGEVRVGDRDGGGLRRAAARMPPDELVEAGALIDGERVRRPDGGREWPRRGSG